MQSRPLRATAGLFPPQERHFTDATTDRRPSGSGQRGGADHPAPAAGGDSAYGRDDAADEAIGRPLERRLLAPRRSGSGHPGALGEQE
jgi:hypothetical protein